MLRSTWSPFLIQRGTLAVDSGQLSLAGGGDLRNDIDVNGNAGAVFELKSGTFTGYRPVNSLQSGPVISQLLLSGATVSGT
jgi:hypothetical protein